MREERQTKPNVSYFDLAGNLKTNGTAMSDSYLQAKAKDELKVIDRDSLPSMGFWMGLYRAMKT